MRAALALLVLALAAARAPAGDVRTAADDVEAVRQLVRQRKWDEGRAAVAQMLEARRDDPDLRPLLGDVEELLQRCLFGGEATEVDPGVAVGPGVVKYVPSTRAVVIETPPEASKRWLREPDGTRTLPVPLEGDVSVEMSWSDADDWAVILGWDPDAGTGWRVEARAQDHSASPGRVVRMTEDGEKLLGTVTPPRAREPATVRISRAGAAILVTADKVQLAQEVANGARRAFVALRPAPDTEADAALPPVRISGRVDARFARNAAASAERTGFQWWRASKYHRETALPPWVLDLEKSSRRWTARGPDVPEASAAAFRDAVRAFFEGDHPALHRRQDELRDVEIPDPARSLLEAMHACVDDRLDEAESALRALHRGNPGSAPIAAALGACLAQRGNVAEAESAYAAARAADPEYAPGYDGSIRLRFEAGDLDGAQALLDAAARAATASTRTVDLRSRVLRARRGPPWTRRAECDAGPFRVAGDVPRAALDAVAKGLAEAAADFATRVRPLPEGTRLRALVFADETAYVDWCRDDVTDVDEDAGYFAAAREVCVHVGATGAIDAALLRRVAAEAHLDALGVRSPWLTAGLPRGLATARGAGAPAGGGLARRYTARFVPWPDLFVADRAAFAADPDVLRAQSAVAAAVLLDPPDPALRGVLGAYLDAVRRGDGPVRAFRASIEPALPAFERAVARR